jgi:SAM-dependent methyltransferase
MRRRLALLPLALVALSTLALAAAQETSSPPSPEELKLYEAFRAWISAQPVDIQKASDDEVMRRYGEVLRQQGNPPEAVTATLAALDKLGDRAEIERWNRILTSPTPRFNTKPNAFLVEMTTGVTPGRALDVGMGQGRNVIYLAQQGWDAVGFDPADRAVAAARQRAAELGVKITTHVARDDEFDWGRNQWDLIVLSYVGARPYVDRVVDGLRPGGMVIVEAFHRDVLKTGPVGGAVVFETNELLQLFSALRVLR